MEGFNRDINLPMAELNAIKFDLMTNGDIEKLSSANIIETCDVTSAKLGLPNGTPQCATCGGSQSTRDCDGHFGVIKLAATVHNPYFSEDVVQLLNQICPGCLHLKQNRDPKRLEGSITQATCKYCSKDGTKVYPGVIFKMLTSSRVTLSNSKFHGNPTRMDRISIIAEVTDRLTNKSKSKGFFEVLPPDYWDFLPRENQPLQSNLTKIVLSPYQIFHILKQIDPELISQFASRRELLFLSCLPVTPNCHRVTERYGLSDGPRVTFDDRTKGYKRMVDVSRRIDDYRQHPQFSILASSLVTSRVMECLKSSKLYSRKTDVESSTDTYGTKWLKDTILSKRSNYAFRSIMVGDPKIRIHEIGIPSDLALNMAVSEHVNLYNFKDLNLKCNMHLLAKEVVIIQRNGNLIFARKANKLQIGDIAYRPLQDGDFILINRPPSVHQHSLIALSAKILPVQSVVSINPLCCIPFKGDFDGDCVHGYIPQSLQSRVELGELVSLNHQLVNAQSGQSLLSFTHDSLISAHLLTSTDVFLRKFEVQQLQMSCLSVSPTPVPSIIKSMGSQGSLCLWTGKQLFSMMLPSKMNFSLDQRLQIVESEMLTCTSGSSWLRNSTSEFFSVMFRQYGCKALEFLSSAQDALCEFITMRGLSVSLSDLYLFTDHYSRSKFTEEVHLALDEAEDAFRVKQLLLNPNFVTNLKCYDDCGDLSNSYEQCDLFQNNLPLVRSSITAFKSVFNDLLRMVQQHVSKDNSMMVMINAGSKGSMLKLTQQTACVGLQLPASKFPFRIPSELSCVCWNRLKFLDREISEGTNECLGEQNFYAVIRSSFIEGLNPLECLLHAISGRANFFSENADVPGTLNRKLMYHLRDIYVAYDGTVRSSYGQQILQFSYDTANDTDSGRDLEGEVGAPVGSWAACSISEAAYAALDDGVNVLEDSPLMILQEVLKCNKGTNSLCHFGLLFLSKNLKKYRYGFEYASLEVKDHLEQILFSDVVDTVMIMYDGCDTQKTKGSPWITHFHLNQEMIKAKRLRLGFVIEEITEQYNALKDQSNNAIPSVYISKGKCSVGNKCANNLKCCITMVARAEANSTSQLDTIKNRVIPSILATLLKGFLEFKNVEIQCQHDNELVVKVGVSEHCKPGKFWATLQNACIPIMELIDWERSRPDSVYDIFCSYGIDSAWKYFVESLRLATDDIGRNICREHFLVVADCLSLSGQFHGLSSQGLKHQRTRLKISSPFSEACFSRPAHSFINAAKQCSVDNLSGALDAISWGKEPHTGTSGSFKIMYSGKLHGPIQNENIYDFLRNPEVQGLENNDMDIHVQNSENSSKLSVRSSEANAFCNGGAIPVEQKFLDAKVGVWDNIIDMRTCLQNMLQEYSLNEHIVEADKAHIIEALKFHPRGHAKIGAGIRDIKIGVNPNHPDTRCFVLLRNDGTTDDVSYRKCVLGAANSISPELGSYMEKLIHHRSGLSH